MSKSHTFNPDFLITDAYDYLLVEWLIRRSLYRQFAENLARALGRKGSTRQLVRDHVEFLIKTPRFLIKDAIIAAFSFADTPEGFSFWRCVSDDWVAFSTNFFRK